MPASELRQCDKCKNYVCIAHSKLSILCENCPSKSPPRKILTRSSDIPTTSSGYCYDCGKYCINYCKKCKKWYCSNHKSAKKIDYCLNCCK